MDQIRWGIIGCGDVTEVKSGPAFNKVPHSTLVAVMRRNAEKAKDYAMRHNVPKWYADADELINDPDINAIYIATPPLQHEEYTLKALAAGKPVYVEKPMTLDAASARRMQIEAERTKLPLVVAHYRREQPLFKHIKSLLEQKTIGEVRLVSLQTLQPPASKLIAKTDENWRTNAAISGGGLFHDLAPHQLDLMTYFFGAPKSAQGISINGAGLYEADDCTAGTILFEKNILFNGQWCFTVAEDESKDFCEIIGSKGKISFKVFQQDAVSVTVNGHVEHWNFDKLEHVQQPMIEAVVNYFRDAAPNPCSAADGVAVMELIDAFSKH